MFPLVIFPVMFPLVIFPVALPPMEEALFVCAKDGRNKTNERLLPNMEKKYWIFINSDIIERTVQGTEQTLVAVHFSYTFVGGKSGLV